MSKRILHISVRADYGGAPNYINTMINNLSEDFEIYLACPKDKPYYSIWKKNSLVKDICFLPHRKFSLNHFFKLLSFIKKNEIRLLQANGKGAGVYGRLIKLFRPKIKIIFAYRGFHIYNYGFFQKRAYFLYEKMMSYLTDKVINVSQGEQDMCVKHGVLKRELSKKIYNGISPLKKAYVKDLEIKYKDKFVIVTLSRFDVQKNMALMYDVAKFLKKYEDIVFLWIGDGEDKDPLERRAKSEGLNNIEFIGFKNHDEIAEYFTISDLYFTTARWEGLPFALIEAASIGLPIVSSDVVGNNEVCLNGKNGILYESEDSKGALQAILSLYNNYELLNVYSEGSFEVFKKHFTVEQMVKSHEDLYNILIDAI